MLAEGIGMRFASGYRRSEARRGREEENKGREEMLQIGNGKRKTKKRKEKRGE